MESLRVTVEMCDWGVSQSLAVCSGGVCAGLAGSCHPSQVCVAGWCFGELLELSRSGTESVLPAPSERTVRPRGESECAGLAQRALSRSRGWLKAHDWQHLGVEPQLTALRQGALLLAQGQSCSGPCCSSTELPEADRHAPARSLAAFPPAVCDNTHIQHRLTCSGLDPLPRGRG